VEYALLLAEEQAEFEKRKAFETAYLSAIATSAGYHGKDAEEQWQFLIDGLKPPDDPGAVDEAEIERICNFTGAPREVIVAALARGAHFPKITVRKV